MNRCLRNDQLERLHQGGLAPEEVARLREHVENCAYCRHKLATRFAPHERVTLVEPRTTLVENDLALPFPETLDPTDLASLMGALRVGDRFKGSCSTRALESTCLHS